MTAIYRLMNDAELSKEKYKASYTGKENVATAHHEIRTLNTPPRLIPLEAPAELPFTLNQEKLEGIHWLPTNSYHDVFSKELIAAISSVGEVDWTLIPAHLFTKKGESVYEGEYQGVLYNEYFDCFDYENSEYNPGIWTIKDPSEVTERDRKEVNAISKFILKKPENGFPPFFRLLARPTEVLISAECQAAIMKANITTVNMYLMGDF